MRGRIRSQPHLPRRLIINIFPPIFHAPSRPLPLPGLGVPNRMVGHNHEVDIREMHPQAAKELDENAGYDGYAWAMVDGLVAFGGYGTADYDFAFDEVGDGFGGAVGQGEAGTAAGAHEHVRKRRDSSVYAQTDINYLRVQWMRGASA